MGAVVCGKPGATWVSGTSLPGSYFISDTRQATNYKALAARSSGKTRARYLSLSKTYTHRAKTHRPVCLHLADPRESVKLEKDKLKRVGTVDCGRLGTTWTPGTLLASGYFISDAQQARNYAALAARSKGKAKVRYLSLARTYTHRAAVRRTICEPPVVPPPPPVVPPPTPLRFSLTGAIGLALRGMSAAGDLKPAAETATGSNLAAINSMGQLSDAVTSGSVSISRFMVAPAGKLYVVFNGPVDLADTSSTASGAPRCLLAEVDTASGAPTCIDSTLQSIDARGMVSLGGVRAFQNPPIQFDSQSAIVYTGRTSDGKSVLRRYLNGSTTDLINDNVFLNDFLVQPDGNVLISGRTAATGAQWTRRVTAAGGLQTITNEAAGFISTFPDSLPYLQLSGGVKRILADADTLESKWWIHNGGDTYNDTSVFCGPPPPPGYSMCNGGYLYTSLFAGRDSNEYGVVLSGVGQAQAELFELYPALKFENTLITDITVVVPATGGVVISGLNASGQNITTLLSPATGSETTLIGPDREIEVYHLSYLAKANRILFDGLRFADNKYVIGQIDLATNQLTFGDTSTVKWADVQGLG